jgi:hypothetical protein
MLQTGKITEVNPHISAAPARGSLVNRRCSQEAQVIVIKLLHFPSRQHRYESALCETNDVVLFQKVEAAESTMLARPNILAEVKECRSEWKAIDEACWFFALLTTNGCISEHQSWSGYNCDTRSLF